MRWKSCGRLRIATGEETRWTCSQEGTGVKPTGKAKERKTPAHLETYENGGTGEEKSHMECDKGHCKKQGEVACSS